MKIYLPPILFLLFSLFATSANAQAEVTPETKDTTKNTSTNLVDMPLDSNSKPPAPPDSINPRNERDIQNQLPFMEPDMNTINYNFYDRRKISTPLMMRYDLDSAIYQKDKPKIKQQKAYLAKQYVFPAKPKDAWEIGVNFGYAFVSGDVKPFVSIKGLFQNMGFGFTVRKALGYTLSVRGGYNFMMMTGRNWEPDHNLMWNAALHGAYDPRVNYWSDTSRLLASKTIKGYNMNKNFFFNYRTYVNEMHFVAILNLGNIRFHRERNMVNFYLLGGGSMFFFATYMDALNANGQVYDFSGVYDLYLHPENYNVNQRNTYRKQALNQLNSMLDGKYESRAEHENNAPGIKNWQFVPAATVGFGLQFHISKWVTFGLEERIILTGSDLLDGYRWEQDEHTSLSTNVDNISYTSINFNFHIGLKKRTEPMYWLNPIYHSYRKLGEVDPAAMANDLFKDDDDDGVPNRLDKEPATKKGCPVDTHGVALDSDHDGILDCDDKETYSPPGYPIDSTGVALLPPNPCCDTTGYSAEPVNRSGYIDENKNIIGPDGKVYPPGTDTIVSPEGKKIPVNTLPIQPSEMMDRNGYIDENKNVVGPSGIVYPPGTDSIMGAEGKKIPVTALPTHPTPATSKNKGRNRGPAGYDCSKISLPDVIFDFEKYYLDPQYYGNLHQIAERMQMCPDMKLVVTGKDESRNDQKFNEQLAWNRANASVDYLVEKYGISRDRYIVKYQGGKKAATGTAYEKKMKSKCEFRYANESEGGDSNPPAPHPGLKAGTNK